MKITYQMFRDKTIPAEGFAELLDAVGWVNDEESDLHAITRSLHHYSFVAHMRDEQGTVVGYISAFSDEVFSTFIGDKVVHPLVQTQGVGSQLLNDSIQEFLYIFNPLKIPKRFFSSLATGSPSGI